MSGLSISYYYFGYLMSGLLIHLTGVVPSVGSNLVVPTSFALTIAGAAGIGYNLAALTPGVSAAVRAAAAAITPTLVAVIGNLEGALEVAYLQGIGGPRFWNWLNIKNLTLPAAAPSTAGVCAETASDYASHLVTPTRFLWWWRASRVMHDGCDTEIIHEFPFFSYMLGDVHPHVMALPFLVLLAGVGLALLARDRDTGEEDAGGRHLWQPKWLAVPLVVGAMGFLNAWDLPISMTLIALAYALPLWAGPPRWREERADLALAGVVAAGFAFAGWRYVPALFGRMTGGAPPAGVFPLLGALAAVGLALASLLAIRRRAAEASADAAHLLVAGRFAAWLAVLAIGLYLPFYLVLESQVRGIGLVGMGTRLSQWTVHMGTLAFFAGTIAAGGWAYLWAHRDSLAGASAAILAAGAGLCAAATIKALAGAAGGRNPWTAILLSVLAAGAAAAVVERARRQSGAGAAATFALLCVAVGFGLPLAVEFVFVRDLFDNRMNSVFKFYYQAWVLLALGGGYAVVLVARRLGESTRAVWAAVAVLLVAAGLVYPVNAVRTRVAGACGLGEEPAAGGCTRALTLDGLRWWDDAHPDDRAAAEWLRANARGTPTILEASGGSYGHPGRISMATGFPTVLGWDFHEAQWGRTWEEDITPRKTDVETIYKTTNIGQMRRLLADYGVDYVVLGSVERDAYGLGAADVERFRHAITPAFESGGVTVFEVPPLADASEGDESS
jgi:uncharacterized membrane protein